MTSTGACMVLQLSLVISMFQSRSYGELYHGGSSSICTRSVIENMIMANVKVVKQRSHRHTPIRLSTSFFKIVRRHMVIRFKESLSKLDETCSQCKHDQRSARKIAVSIVEELNDIALDQQWLKRYVGRLNSGHPLLQLRSPATRATLSALAIPAGEVNPEVIRQPGDLILRVDGRKRASPSAARSTETPGVRHHVHQRRRDRKQRPEEHPGDPRCVEGQRQAECHSTSVQRV